MILVVVRFKTARRFEKNTASTASCKRYDDLGNGESVPHPNHAGVKLSSLNQTFPSLYLPCYFQSPPSHPSQPPPQPNPHPHRIHSIYLSLLHPTGYSPVQNGKKRRGEEEKKRKGELDQRTVPASAQAVIIIRQVLRRRQKCF